MLILTKKSRKVRLLWNNKLDISISLLEICWLAHLLIDMDYCGCGPKSQTFFYKYKGTSFLLHDPPRHVLIKIIYTLNSKAILQSLL